MNLDKQNELEVFCSKYFSESCDGIHICDDDDIYSEGVPFINFLDNIIPFDHPDGYAILNGESLIVEHFEFDSSDRKPRKGSQQRRIDAQLDREFNELEMTTNFKSQHKIMSVNQTMDNYIRNFTSIFQAHYNQINSYKQNLIDQNKISIESKISTAFFIDDVTELGNIIPSYDWNSSGSTLVLVICDFFLDLFEKCTELDFILFGCFDFNQYCVYYIDHRLIPCYRRAQITTSETSLCNLRPFRSDYEQLHPKN